MSSFFDSEVVKQSLSELSEIQGKLIQHMLYIPVMSKDQKEQYLQLSKDFLEKQKNLFFRMSLSDDSEAKSACEQIMGNAKMFGLVVETTPNELFTYLENIIDKLEESINS